MVEEYGIATEATDYNIAHALCILDDQDYKNT